MVETFNECTPVLGTRTSLFGIYVHIPFCVHRCSYCDFFSLTHYNEDVFTALTDSLVHEIQDARHYLGSKGWFDSKVTSIFLGGGTPSIFPLPLLERVFATIENNFSIARHAEVTIEANPETVSDSFCKGIKSLGWVNRISMGAQSFSEDFLKKLERPCTPNKIRKACERVQANGIENYNLDLIYAIPGQTVEQFIWDIDQAVQLNPKHVSAYTLTLKQAHPLFDALPSDELSAEMFEKGADFLDSLDYPQYEISNYARKGYQCRHNLLYWSGGDFLGVGPSASSRFFADGKFIHRKQISDLRQYLARKGFTDSAFESSTSEQTVLEAAFLELRKTKGVYLPEFQKRYGHDFRKNKRYDSLIKEDLIAEKQNHLILTRKGRLLADSIAVDLV